MLVRCEGVLVGGVLVGGEGVLVGGEGVLVGGVRVCWWE